VDDEAVEASCSAIDCFDIVENSQLRRGASLRKDNAVEFALWASDAGYERNSSGERIKKFIIRNLFVFEPPIPIFERFYRYEGLLCF
jgi:hypothetical protein